MRYALMIAALMITPAICMAQSPSVDIKCNGLDSNITIPSGVNVEITYDITAGNGAGYDVDIWILLKTGSTYYSYNGLGPMLGWNYGRDTAFHTGPLADFQGTALDYPLEDGTYVGHIAIDVVPDGILDPGSFYFYDRVDFKVETPEGMAFIPPGAYEMGDHHDTIWQAQPVHSVYISAFFMDIYETTNDAYCTFLNSAYGQGQIEVISDIVYKTGDTEPYCDTAATGTGSRINWDGATFTVTASKENHPMCEVTWYGAAAYANWRSEQEGLTPCYDMTTWECNFDADGYRLPTEAEWEKAARGGEYDPYLRYPWGDQINGSCANYLNSGDPFEGIPIRPETTPVGYYDGNQIPAGVDMANGYGLYDMAGNMAEWCNDWYDPQYYSVSPYFNPKGPPSQTGRGKVLRSGMWDVPKLYHRTAFRAGLGPPRKKW
jgi:formylglycine-generating enzyme required for sulfatase activity